MGNIYAHGGIPRDLCSEAVQRFLYSVTESRLPESIKRYATDACDQSSEALIVKKSYDVINEYRYCRVNKIKQEKFGAVLVKNIPLYKSMPGGTRQPFDPDIMEKRVSACLSSLGLGEVTSVVLLVDKHNNLTGSAHVAFYHPEDATAAAEKGVAEWRPGHNMSIQLWDPDHRDPRQPTRTRGPWKEFVGLFKKK
jgi:hypothetical protein